MVYTYLVTVIQPGKWPERKTFGNAHPDRPDKVKRNGIQQIGIGGSNGQAGR